MNRLIIKSRLLHDHKAHRCVFVNNKTPKQKKKKESCSALNIVLKKEFLLYIYKVGSTMRDCNVNKIHEVYLRIILFCKRMLFQYVNLIECQLPVWQPLLKSFLFINAPIQLINV